MNTKTDVIKTDDTKKLIQFEGGGYDGCIWEYNFILLLNPDIYDTPILDVAISGHHGKMFKKLVEANPSKYYNNPEALESDFNSGNIFIWNLENEDKLKEFATTQNDLLVKGVLKYFDLELGIELYIDCPVCEYASTHFDMNFHGWHDSGGITMSPDSWHCNECDSTYHCDKCECYDESTKNFTHNDIDYSMCNECKESFLENEEEKNKDILKSQVEHNAMINGHPLSQWSDYYYDDSICCDCLTCNKKYIITFDNRIQEDTRLIIA